MSNKYFIHHGTAIQSSCATTISNCKFISNKGSKSLIYFECGSANRNYKNISVDLINSSFNSNEGVSIYLSGHFDLHISGEVLFENSVAEDGAGMCINDHSTVMFGKNSNTKFINNFAYHNGAAIFLYNNSSAIFDNNSKVMFHNNKANIGTVYSKASCNVIFRATCKVTFKSNSATQYGAAIYSFDNSQVVLTGNATTSFIDNIISFNNTYLQDGGTILTENNGYIIFEENSNTLFSNNIADFGAGIFVIQNSNVIFKDNSWVMFNNNIAHYCGVLTSTTFSNITFTDNNKVTYDTNTVSYTLTNNYESSAGTICAFQRSQIIITKHSLVTFSNNKADRGGAVRIGHQ